MIVALVNTVRTWVAILVFRSRTAVFIIQKIRVRMSGRNCKTAIQYLKIIATDFKCFQFSSLINQFPLRVPAGADWQVYK